MFNEPIYIGMRILDISKNCMYDFYYNIMKERYREKIKLLYMDTDSLIMEIKTDDFYADVKSMIHEFDTSDYPKDNPYGLPLVNKKVLGKFKDEVNGKVIEEFIGLRSKLYAFKVFGDGNETKKAKGVKKSIVQKEICFDDFKKCLLTKEPIYKKQNLFRTKRHDIYTVEQNKKALIAHDDKRHILSNGLDTLAWVHYQIKVEKDQFLNHLKELTKLVDYVCAGFVFKKFTQILKN